MSDTTHLGNTPSIDIEGWSCPIPLRHQDRIVIGHGGGGVLSGELIRHLFLPAFGDAARTATATDSHVLDLGNGTRLAFSTDTYVVRPLFFPGGNIGELAVFGTVNDLAMSGARPLALSTGFVLEEGLEVDVLGRIATAMGAAATRAGVQLVTGDTKVVERGHGDGVYINTAGIGVVPDGVDICPERARPGDIVIVSGPIGMHGVAVMSVREGLEFGTELRSDTAPLNGLVAAMLDACVDLHVLRDPTRGGLASATNEIAASAKVGLRLEESAIPLAEQVRGACEILGLDPLYVANEGKCLAIVAPAAAEHALALLRAHPLGREAAIIGEVVADHPGRVMMRSRVGGMRIVDMLSGEQLPRIC
jgi:hydrogenase expression/formation protein HypE